MSVHKILKPGRNCWDVGEANKTGLLVDAREYYRAFYHAAKAAESYILLSGWQFDSNVDLLRGEDAKAARSSATLLSFLNDLCEQKTALRIYILALDFSMLYSIESSFQRGEVHSARRQRHAQIRAGPCRGQAHGQRYGSGHQPRFSPADIR
jgi:phosphatidylserine/phosphatidylglycerophosphate/cardiolipin synthase-like enzyme